MGCGRACERVTGPQRPAPIPWTPGPGGSHRQPPTYVKGAAVGSRARRMEVPKSFGSLKDRRDPRRLLTAAMSHRIRFSAGDWSLTPHILR